MRAFASWALASFAAYAPDAPVVSHFQPANTQPAFIATTTPTPTISTTWSEASSLKDHITLWVSNNALVSAPPSKADVQLLRQAFAEFYGVNRDLVESERLLTQAIERWQQQPPDELAGLYRVRGDCYTLLADAEKAVSDYGNAIRLLQGPGGEKADPSELPAALLGRARAIKSQKITIEQAKQAAADYELSLKLSSREEWETDQELLEDGVTRNPYAAWELGTTLRRAGEWSRAAEVHKLAANAFDEIGDKARSVISLLDAGIDLAAAGQNSQAESTLRLAIPMTKGVEGRDVALLQRVVAKEGEGRMALAAILWDQGNRVDAEGFLGDACIRLDQLQADIVARMMKTTPKVDETSPRLQFSIDDDIAVFDMSCSRFRKPTFLADQLGWPESLRQKVIKLETLR